MSVVGQKIVNNSLDSFPELRRDLMYKQAAENIS